MPSRVKLITCGCQALWPRGVWHHRYSDLVLTRLLPVRLLLTTSVSGMSSAGQSGERKKSPMSAKCHCPFHLLFQNQIIAIESCSRISCEINKACSTANVKVVNFYFSDKWSFIIHRIAIFPAICILVKDLKKSFQYAHLPIRPPGGTWVVHNA